MGRLLGSRVLVLGLLASAAVNAYTPTRSSEGIAVRWKGRPRLELVGNPTNSSGLTAGEFSQAVVRGLRRWESASSGQVTFDFWSGTNASEFEANSEYNGHSSIYFVSHSKEKLASNVLGVTQVWYDTRTGEILETDIALNDTTYRFTTRATDTSSGGGNFVFIENVITHELGHALGLSHSGGSQSTMLFMEAREQAHLSCDEVVGIHGIYPSDLHHRGGVSGRVVSGSVGVSGANVQLISRRRGTVLATAVSDSNGTYRVDSLEEGDYSVLVEPFFAATSALPELSLVESGGCGSGQRFARTVLLEGAGQGLHQGLHQSLQMIAVLGEGKITVVPTIQVGCNSNFPSIPSGSPLLGGLVTQLDRGQSRKFRLNQIQGALEIHGVSASVLSPIRTQLALLNARTGMQVASAVALDSVYTGESGFVNQDSLLSAADLPLDDYDVLVTAFTVSSGLNPMGSATIDPSSFVLLTESVAEGPLPLGAILPSNARCRIPESQAAYVSPSETPPRHGTDRSGAVGFCGTVRKIHQRASSAEQFGWFFPWIILLGIPRLAKIAFRPQSDACASDLLALR